MITKPIIIAGAGGHAIEVYQVIIENNSNANISFFDDVNSKQMLLNRKVYNSLSEIKNELNNEFLFVLGVGDPESRLKLKLKLESIQGKYMPIKSSLAKTSNNQNNFDVMDLTYIGPLASIAIGVLLNTGSQVHHECFVGDFTEISPGAIILGKSRIGKFCSIGSNSTILPSIEICDCVTIGAGSVVVKNINEKGTYAGIPAKKIR